MVHKTLHDPCVNWSPVITAPQQPLFHGAARPTILQLRSGRENLENICDHRTPSSWLPTGPRNPTALPPYTRGSLEKSKMRAGRYRLFKHFSLRTTRFSKKNKKQTIYIKIISLKLLEWTPVFPLSYYPADGISQKRSD